MVAENGKTANGTAPAGSAAGPSRPKSNDVDDDDAVGGGTGDDARQTVLEQHGYRVLRTLGHGSYATVKSAYSDRHQTNVAIKIISKRRAPADYIEKFLPREINIVKILKHQNLVTFLQSIETNTRVYIIMEEATGGDLLNVVRKQKRLTERQAGFWLQQLCAGVEYCHQRGVVHRDLKCENLLLDGKGNLKIIDFGFARAEMFPVDGRFKRSETFCGSYAYAAPEILMGVAYIPQMADVWSMGIILYVMVIGRLPFDDTNHKKLLKMILAGPIFPPNRESTREFQDLIIAILKREEYRIGIPEIRNTLWYTQNTPST